MNRHELENLEHSRNSGFHENSRNSGFYENAFHDRRGSGNPDNRRQNNNKEQRHNNKKSTGSKLEQYRNRAGGGNENVIGVNGGLSKNPENNLKSSQNSDRSQNSTDVQSYPKSNTSKHNRRDKSKSSRGGGKGGRNYRPDDQSDERNFSFGNPDREIIVNKNDNRVGEYQISAFFRNFLQIKNCKLSSDA